MRLQSAGQGEPTMKKFLVLTSILISLILSSKEGGSETVEVKIIKSTFIPAVIKVKKGDTVRWVIQKSFYIQ